MRARRAGRAEVPYADAVAALVRAHPALDAEVATRIGHHSRDVLARIEPTLDVLDARGLAFAAERLDALDPPAGAPTRTVLFLSTRNDGMSIMAEAFVAAEGADVGAASAGTRPVGRVLRSVVDALDEVGVASDGYPKPLAEEVLARADVVVTMLCDAPPLRDGQRHEAWDDEDPAGLGPTGVRALRDRVRERVRALLAD